MKKSNKSVKQRKARAKKGQKNFKKGKRSSDNKHIRAEKRRIEMLEKQRRLENLIDKLSNVPQDNSAFANVNPSNNTYNNDNLFGAK